MNESKLKKLYEQADSKKLVEIFSESMRLHNDGNEMVKQAESMSDNITTAVSNRFENIGIDLENCAYEQLNTMSKQWSILSASMVNVKRSIKLTNFHNELNLFVNSKYGIKIYKCYSRYSPFLNYNIESMLDKDKAFRYLSSRLIFERPYDSCCSTLDFIALQSIPQLNHDKISLLMEMTEDIVHMIDSWRNFYGAKKDCKVNTIKEMESIESNYGIQSDAVYLNNLKKLDKLLAFKQKLSNNLIRQSARWEKLIDKWKAVNKSFLVLNELTNSELKI